MFRVTLAKAEGGEETRTIDAPSRFAVYEQMEKEGATVQSIEEGGGFRLPSWTSVKLTSGIKTELKINFTKNLAAMLAAGLTLSRALAVIERQSKNKYLSTIVVSIQDSVKAGSSFHEALAKYPGVFSTLFISMTRAGEESGKLGESLMLVARQMDRTYTLTKKIKGAMIYPAIILGAIVVIGVLMLMFVVPTLASTFASFGGKLPLATRVIIGASDFLRNHAVLVLGLMAIVVAGFVSFTKSRAGERLLLFAMLHFPVVGELTRETYSARAARTLASLLSSGVEMLGAIGIAREVVGENVFGAVLEEASTRVRKGETLSAAFADHGKLYPFFMADMIAVGEETGKVAEMLQQVAEYYEADVEERTKDLSTIIEPLLMLFIGVFVGIFAYSMISPIYSLSSQIS